MDAVPEELSQWFRKVTCHVRWISQIRVLILLQPAQAVAENQAGTRLRAAVCAGTVRDGAEIDDRGASRRLGHHPTVEIKVTGQCAELAPGPHTGGTILDSEIAQRPHHVHQIFDAVLHARPHFLVAMRNLLPFPGVNTDGLREIQLVPVAVRPQHFVHDGEYERVRYERMRGLRLQQHRSQPGRVPAVKISLAVRRRHDPGLELTTNTIDGRGFDQVLENHIPLRPQEIQGSGRIGRAHLVKRAPTHAATLPAATAAGKNRMTGPGIPKRPRTRRNPVRVTSAAMAVTSSCRSGCVAPSAVASQPQWSASGRKALLATNVSRSMSNNSAVSSEAQMISHRSASRSRRLVTPGLGQKREISHTSGPCGTPASHRPRNRSSKGCGRSVRNNRTEARRRAPGSSLTRRYMTSSASY